MPKTRLKTIVCLNCGTKKTAPSRYIVGKGKYCCFECFKQHGAGAHLRNGGYKKCVNCGKQFYLRGCYMKDPRRKYCSQKCYHATRAVKDKECLFCGETFKPKNKTQKYCSHKCSKSGKQNPNWAGGVTPRKMSRVWTQSVFKRDGYRCVICGSQGRLHAHHLDGYHWCKDRRFDVSNGVTLCVPCHKEFHSQYGTRRNTESQFIEFQQTKQEKAA